MFSSFAKSSTPLTYPTQEESVMPPHKIIIAARTRFPPVRIAKKPNTAEPRPAKANRRMVFMVPSFGVMNTPISPPRTISNRLCSILSGTVWYQHSVRLFWRHWQDMRSAN